VTQQNRSTQLSAIRRLKYKPFDFLVGVVYAADFSISYAAEVPHLVVLERATYSKHTNSHIFHMRRDLLDDPRVVDITARLSI